MNNPRPSLVRGGMVIASSLVVAGALTFLTSIIIARSVGVTEFGYYSITVSLQGIAILFSSFGLGVAAAKFVAEYLVRDYGTALKFAKAGFRLVLLFALLTATTYFALAGVIGNGLYDEPEVANLIPFSALVAISSAILGLASGLAQGNQRMKLVAMVHMMSPAISVTIIVMMLPSLGVKAAFIGLFIAQTTVALVTLLRLARTGFPLTGHVQAKTQVPYYKMLLSFAIPSVMAGVMITPIFWLGNTVLTLESGFVAMGYFGVAMVFFQALNNLATSIYVPLVPRVSEMSVHSMEQIGPLAARFMRTSSFVFFPLFFAGALFSRVVIGVLYGSKYYDSSDAAYMMVAASFFYVLASPVSATIAGLGRMWVSLGLNIIWAAMYIVLMLLLVPSEGPLGLGMAFAISYAVHVCNSLAVADKVLHLKIRDVVIAVIPAALLFAFASPLLMEEWGDGLVFKLLLLALGSAVMLYLGRKEYRIVLERIMKG